MTTAATAYRAAYVNDCNLTGVDDAHLADEDLLALAIERATEDGLIGGESHQISAGDIVIGDWSE